jgi:hypothetical protein
MKFTRGVLNQKEQDQYDYIKSVFEVCETDTERRAVFFAYATDISYPRHIILLVIKNLGINDDMNLKKDKDNG